MLCGSVIKHCRSSQVRPLGTCYILPETLESCSQSAWAILVYISVFQPGHLPDVWSNSTNLQQLQAEWKILGVEVHIFQKLLVCVWVGGGGGILEQWPKTELGSFLAS